MSDVARASWSWSAAARRAAPPRSSCGSAATTCCCVDAARFPRDKVCGESVSPEAWRLLDALGAAAAVRALRPTRCAAWRSPRPTAPRSGATTRAAASRASPCAASASTRALLGARAGAGVEVREGTRVTGLRVEGAAASPGVDARERRAAPRRLARPARGGRRRPAQRRRPAASGCSASTARLRKFAVRGLLGGHARASSEHGEMHVGGGGYCGVAPLSADAGQRRLRPRPARDAAGRRRPRGASTATRSRPLAAARRAPRRARASWPAPKAIGPLALEARARLGPRGRCSSATPPASTIPSPGEGVTLALRSAELAAEVADARPARGGAPTTSATYDRLRDAATRDKFRLNRLLQRVVAWPGAEQRRGRGAWRAARTSPTSSWASPATSSPPGRPWGSASSTSCSRMSGGQALPGHDPDSTRTVSRHDPATETGSMPKSVFATLIVTRSKVARNVLDAAPGWSPRGTGGRPPAQETKEDHESESSR